MEPEKMEEIALLQAQLRDLLIGLARATEGNHHALTFATAAAMIDGLLTTTSKDKDALQAMIRRVDTQKQKLVPGCYVCTASCGRNDNYDWQKLLEAEDNIRNLKYAIWDGARGVAKYAYRAALLGCKDEAVYLFLYRALFAIGMEDWGEDLLQPIVAEAAQIQEKLAKFIDDHT